MYESEDGHAVVCSNITYKVIEVRDISVKLDTGYVLKLKEVRYIPEMVRNLISVGELEKSGLIGKIENGILKIIK